MARNSKKRLFRLFAMSVALGWTNALVAATDGELQLDVVDSVTRKPLPVRVEFTNARGRAVRMKKIGVGALGSHFYLPGKATLGLRRGGYLFTLDAGAEYRTQRGNFEIERHADDAKTVEMRRFANLGDEGWFAGDLDARRPTRDLPLMAAAEGLHYVPTISWHYSNGKWKPSHATVQAEVDITNEHTTGRELGPCAALVDLAGGSLMLIADHPLAQQPIEIAAGASSLDVIASAHQAGLHVVAASPTAWDMPLWIAGGHLDAVMLLTRSSEQKSVSDKDPNGRPRDRGFYPGKQGLARWSQDIYFHLLNCGIRLSPVAGSGSGDNKSPLGTNRCYVHLANDFTQAAWWQSVANGATVVTNGPLLRPNVGGDPPGQVFRLDSGERVEYQIALNLASRDTVEYLEIIKNGEVDAEVRLSDWASKGGRLPPVAFESSGWFAVRAVTNNPNKYQMAFTAPYYVESPVGPRLSKQSVDFFLAWLDELETRLDSATNCSQAELDSARNFWQNLQSKANAP